MNILTTITGMLVSASVGFATMSQLDEIANRSSQIASEVAVINYEQTVKSAIAVANLDDTHEYKMGDYTNKQTVKSLVDRGYIDAKIYEHTTAQGDELVVNNLEIGDKVATEISANLNKGE